ncbi:MAG: transporter substrate-binding domain-containing protein [Rhodocyclaceae bacterium]
MKHVRALATLLLFCAATQPLAAEEIRVNVTDALRDYQPAVEALLREAGFQPSTRLYPSERSIRMLEAGDIDIEAFRIPSGVQALGKRVRLVGPAACASLLAFVRADSDWKSVPGQLPAHRIGVMLGSRAAEEAALRQFGPDFKRVTTPAQLFQMLAADRIDMALEFDSIGFAQIHALQLDGQLRALHPPVRFIQAYLALRQHHDDWGPRIDKALARMLADGRWLKAMAAVEQARQFPQGMTTDCLRPATKPTSKPVKKPAPPG